MRWPSRRRRKSLPRGGLFAVGETAEATLVESDPTWVMRHSPYPLWEKLRARMQSEGVQVETAVLAVSYEDGPNPNDVEEIGVIVATDGRIISFRYHVAGYWTEWADVTASWRDLPHADSVNSALARL
jgi:hypothetical protein